MSLFGRFALFGVAALGGGYAISGENDFEVKVHQPQAEVYSAFSGARTFTGGLRRAGYASVSVRTERPSANEIVYWSGEEGADNSMRIALTFAPTEDGRVTTVTAAIDVPAVRYEIDGETLYLSESKVENVFEENLTAIAAQLSQGRDATDELGEFRDMLDLVALATDPEGVKRLDTATY